MPVRLLINMQRIEIVMSFTIQRLQAAAGRTLRRHSLMSLSNSIGNAQSTRGIQLPPAGLHSVLVHSDQTYETVVHLIIIGIPGRLFHFLQKQSHAFVPSPIDGGGKLWVFLPPISQGTSMDTKRGCQNTHGFTLAEYRLSLVTVL